MIISTVTKISLARWAARLVLLGRAVAGRGPLLEITRGGLRWGLDLREGIDFSIFLLGGFEPRTLRAYRGLVPEGGVVIDVGANVGSQTLPLARLVGPRGRVHAIEPTGYALGKLRANVALNPDLAGRVQAHQLMLVGPGGGGGVPFVYSSWPLEKAVGLHEKHLGRLMSTAGAAAATLDQLVEKAGLARVDFIKIDVDGGEPGVIAGGVATLSRFAPALLMEFAPYLYRGREEDFRGMLATLDGLGYRLRDADSGRELDPDPEALARAIPDGATANVVLRVR